VKTGRKARKTDENRENKHERKENMSFGYFSDSPLSPGEKYRHNIGQFAPESMQP
jgi:hypothetical protein